MGLSHCVLPLEPEGEKNSTKMLHTARTAPVPETSHAVRHISTSSPVGSAGQSSPPVYSDLLGLTDTSRKKKKQQHTRRNGSDDGWGQQNDPTRRFKQHICNLGRISLPVSARCSRLPSPLCCAARSSSAEKHAVSIAVRVRFSRTRARSAADWLR